MADPITRKYVCASCAGQFVAGWSEEEALAEFREKFGDMPMSDAVEVCDACWRAMHAAEAVERN